MSPKRKRNSQPRDVAGASASEFADFVHARDDRTGWVRLRLPEDHAAAWWRTNFCWDNDTYGGGPLDGCAAKARGSPRFFIIAFRPGSGELASTYLERRTDEPTADDKPLVGELPLEAGLLGWYEWFAADLVYRWHDARRDGRGLLGLSRSGI